MRCLPGSSDAESSSSPLLLHTTSVSIFNLMVEFETDAVFTALSDATRRDILARLRSGSARITEIAASYPLSLNAVSKHLKILERAGLISRTVAGREHWCSLDARPLQRVQLEFQPQRPAAAERFDAVGVQRAGPGAGIDLRLDGGDLETGQRDPFAPTNLKRLFRGEAGFHV